MLSLILAAQLLAPAPQPALPNDHLRAGGRLADGVLTIRLVAREVAWYPETRDGPAIHTYAFAEEGNPAYLPGPMIRVPAGTRVRATVRNALAKPIRMRGLQDRTGARLDSADVEPGDAREFDFIASTEGTFYYWGRTEGTRTGLGRAEDAGLHAALIVDPAGTRPDPRERVLMISLWAADSLPGRPKHPDGFETITVNGLSWPHTERLGYTAGDTVRWRVINTSVAPHPMHLHGFYFQVDSRGTAYADTIYRRGDERLVVTEQMLAGTTMQITWVPERAGNWLFHCHLIDHVSVEHVRLEKSAHPAHGAPTARQAPHNHALSGMAGLVTGILVKPRRGVQLAGEPAPHRRLRAFVNERPKVFGDAPGFSMVLQQGSAAPAADSVTFPGSQVIVHQGEPTEITVHNRARQPVTIHWHGIELDSFYDGVGDWSGWGDRVAPPIAPGDSFVVRMTPVRAGTFIYHTHNEEGGQLSSGLYGPLLVLPKGEEPDTTVERMFLIGAGGPRRDALPFINGTATPPPMHLVAGRTYRMRFINISPSQLQRVKLHAAGDTTSLQEWRFFAKDGAELPAHQAVRRPSLVFLGPGETYDYEFTGNAGAELVLEVTTSGRLYPRHVTKVPVRVR